MPGTSFSSASWSGYDEATVTNPASAVTDFTLLIDVSTLSASWKAAVQSDGADIRITKGDGTTELAYDLISWAYNAGAPTGWLRVLWSGSLASSGSQLVRVWAGYTGGTAVAYDATETYGSDNAYDADWVQYLPLDEASGTVFDRTANGIDSTAVTGGYGATGKVGGCFDFANTHRISFGTPAAAANLSPLTIMAWAGIDHVDNLQENRVWDRSVSGLNISGTQLCGYGAYHKNGMKIAIQHATTTAYAQTATNFWTGVAGSSLHHFAGTWDGSSAPKMYTDGADDTDGAVAPSGARTDDSAQGLYVGNSIYNNRDWRHEIDDLQVHSAERSVAWIAEEYAQSNDQSSFWGTWAWTAAGGGGPTYGFAGDGSVPAGATGTLAFAA